MMSLFRAFLLAPALAAGLALIASPARADSEAQHEETITYTVQAGDTCAGIATKVYGDRKYIDLIHHYNPGLGAPPHNLKVGSTLTLPKSPPGEKGGGPDARLARVRNDVRIETPESRQGKPDDPLFRGNRVATAEKSWADLMFVDETQLQLSEDTLVVILGDTHTATNVRSTTLVTGALRAHLAELAGAAKPLEVATKSSTVKMGPGEARVHVDAAATTRLAVYQGSGSLSAQKKTVKVDSGFGSKAENGKAPTPPKPLPPPPTWSVAPSSVVFADGTGKADLSGVFASSVPVSGYHVQIAHDPKFEDRFVDAEVPPTVDKVLARNVETGATYVRVSAVDTDHFEGPFAPPSTTVVATLTTTRSATQVSFAVSPASVLCALDDAPLAPMSAPLVADRFHSHRLRCAASADAGVAVSELAVAADPAPPAPPPPRVVPHPIAPPPPPRDHTRLELALGAGLATAEQPRELGHHFEVGAGARIPWGPGALSLGGLFGVDRFDPKSTSLTDLEGWTTPETATVSHTDFLFSLRAAYVLSAGAYVRPYLSVAPGLAVQHGIARTNDASQRLDALGLELEGALGIGLSLAPAEPFIEVGYRLGGTVDRNELAAPLRGPNGQVGLRALF